MKEVAGLLKDYWKDMEKRMLAIAVFFTGLLVFINYYWGLNRRISTQDEFTQWIWWFLIFLGIFSFSYLLVSVYSRPGIFRHGGFLFLLIAAPALFSWKMSYDFNFNFSRELLANEYWNAVIYWPLKMVLLTSVLWLIWKFTGGRENFFGLSFKHFRPAPYLKMLILMIPLIILAAFQPSFRMVYPRLQNIGYLATENSGGIWKEMLYEISYGIDFITIELFFRGFAVLAFTRWAGRDAILPMACFYCAIHFGKPAGECISSFFGGIILGVVVYHSRTIFGGLLVHLGIAWLMELAGYIALNMVKS